MPLPLPRSSPFRTETPGHAAFEITRGAYQLETFSTEDVAEARRIMERFEDLHIGLADASVVVLAKRHRVLDLLCTDEPHFRALRGAGESRFGCCHSTPDGVDEAPMGRAPDLRPAVPGSVLTDTVLDGLTGEARR